MSRRERRLAMVAGIGVGLMLLYLIVMPAYSYLQGLNMQVESLEEAVYSNTYQAAMSEVVSKRYGELASQHSTGWTEAEISDGLQRELDRLSMADPTGKDPKAKSGKLLSIQYRPEGQLTPFTGYREYQTTFTTQPTGISEIAEFVRRIQESPQTLRIDKLDLRRDNPLSSPVVAQITVTRTVVDAKETDAPKAEEATKEAKAPKQGGLPIAALEMTGNVALNPGFEIWDAAKSAFPGWQAVNGTLSVDNAHAVDGKNAAKLEATQDNAAALELQQLPAGKTFRISFVAAATGKASFDIFDQKAGKSLMPAQALRADGKMYKYTVEAFVVPGEAGKTVELAIPRILAGEKGGVVFFDQVELEAVKK
jgi:hypothetical protein